MSLLQSAPRLAGFGHSTAGDDARPGSASGKATQTDQKQLRSTSSIANLIDFVRNPSQNVNAALESWYDGMTKEERERRQGLADRKQLLYVKMRMATSYADWETAAKELDDVEGNNEWKAVFDSPDYDAQLVKSRLAQLDDARISCDIERMLFLVRTSLTRDLGDMGNLKMYKHSHIGTKDLVERYINSALETLDALLRVSDKAKCDGLESKYILEQVLSSRQAFGRSALLLSGGATFGMNHIGVLKALWEARLLPRIISGASAGSIVGAVYCTRVDEEVPHLMETFCDGDLAVFDEEGNEDGLVRKAVRFLKHGALFDINHLTRVMRDLLGDLTFQEAYNRTRKILNICVSSASLYELPRLLNYVTAPNVLIWSAVAASCSVPFVYTPASILAKDPKTGEAVPWNPSPQRWIDGSVDNDIPMTRLAEMFNVNHFIVSQVNPHVVPFVMKEENSIAQEALQASSFPSAHAWIESLSQLAKSEALHRMHTLIELGVFPTLLTKTVSVLSQKYSGDITIFPEISYADFPRMLSNPTPEFMHQAMLSGQQATWPKLSIIKNHCAIELALDDAIQKLRARVVFSPQEVEMRMGVSQLEKRSSDSHNAVRNRTRRRRVSRGSIDTTLSAPATAKPNASTPTLHGGTERPRSSRETRSGRPTSSYRHKKPLSINTAVAPERSTSRTPSAGMLEPPRLAPSHHHHHHHQKHGSLMPSHALYDVTSSGADETSNLSHSSSSTSLSTTASQTTPVEGETTKWARSLFGPTSSSQPNTPSDFSKLSLTPRTSSKKPSSTTTASVATTTTAASTSKSQSKTQSSHPTPTRSAATSPESQSRYKRIFHPPRARHGVGAAAVAAGSGNESSPSSSSKLLSRARGHTPPATTNTSTAKNPPPPPLTSSLSSSSNRTPTAKTSTTAPPPLSKFDISKSVAKGLVGGGKKGTKAGTAGKKKEKGDRSE